MHAFLHVLAIVTGYTLMAAFAWVFGVWLPRSGKPRDPDDDELRPATA